MLSIVLDLLLTILEGAAILPARRDGVRSPGRGRRILAALLLFGTFGGVAAAIWLVVRAVSG